MKQLIPLFLFLLPCLAWAQYPSNGNQKITLGEQTTADGLIYRGVAATDTVRKPSIDTMAYMVLDTTTNIIWHYKKATSNAWLRVGGSISSGVTGTLPVANGGTGTTSFSPNNYLIRTNSSGIFDTSAVYEVGGKVGIGTASPNSKLDIRDAGTTIPALGQTGTGLNIRRADGNIGLMIGYEGTYGGSYIQSQHMNSAAVVYPLLLQPNGGNVGINTVSPEAALDIVTTTTSLVARFNSNQANASFRIINSSTNGGRTYSLGSGDNTSLGGYGLFVYDETAGAARLLVNNVGNVGIGTTSPTQSLHVVGNARITAMNGIGDIGADANGVLQAATSDMNLKNTIENSPFGLNEILLLNPVTFLYNDTDRKIDSDVKEVGFIAQDVFDIIPNAVTSTGTGDLQLDYRAITATLTKAIQEQNLLIKALEQRLLILENK